MREEEIKLNNKNLYYRSIGNGPTVLFIHGFSEDGNIWENQISSLKGFRLIIPDLPGSGRSDIQDDMSMEGLADYLSVILNKENDSYNGSGQFQSKTVVIGHSMGGYIALAMAEKYPYLLSGLGLFHSTAFADTEEKKAIRRQGINMILTKGVDAFIQSSMPNLYSSVTKEEKQALVAKQILLSCNFSARALVYYYNSMINRPDRTSILKNCNIPVLFIIGKYDNSVPYLDSLKQCHLPDFAYIYSLDRSAHMGMQEQPEKSNKYLSDYLNNIYIPTR